MISTLGSIGHAILVPLYYVTTGILVIFHELFHGLIGMPPGISWVLSIIGLTLVIRTALIPLFVKQIKNSRNLQLLQPRVKELQKKYGHDRERLTQETMKLYKESGTNPLASCFPLLLQMPIFIALFRTLDNAVKNHQQVGVFTKEQVASLGHAAIGNVHIADTFTGATTVTVKIVTALLVVLMTATTFTTQRQLMRKNMPDSALTGQYAQQQKMLLYVLPVVFAIGGIAFPIGVLVYWSTSNLWTMGQQFYVIRNNPTPGTPAFEAKRKRELEKRAGSGLPAIADSGAGDGQGSPAVPPKPPPARNQPRRDSRKKRKRK